MATEPQATSQFPGARPWRRRGGRAGIARSSFGHVLWRHKLFLACVAVCAVALTAVHAGSVPALYEADTLVLIGPADGQVELPDQVAVPIGERGPATEIEAIRSQAMAERLVDALSLHLLPEFNPLLRTGSAGPLDWFDPGRLVPNALFNRLPVALRRMLSERRAMSDAQQAASLRAEVAAQALDHIEAQATDRAAVIRVKFSSIDPRLAELGANTLASLYLADRLAAEQAVSSKAEAFLRGEIARLRESIADGLLAGLSARVRPAAAAHGDAQAWDRTVRADRELLATYRARLREIVALVSARDVSVRVLSAATTPDQPVDSRRKLSFGIALVAALLVGALATLGLERLDNTISSAEQLGALRLARLGELPTIPRGHDHRRALDRHVLDYPDGPFGQAVAAMRNALVRANAVSRRTTLLIAAPRSGDGATLTALSLARCHARAGGQVLLIDCDLAGPRLQELSGAGAQEGLGDVLRGQRTLDQVLRRDERSGALLVTAGTPARDGAALLGSEAMRALIREVAPAYEMVILDGPPVLAGQDARLLSQLADGTVLVARWGNTRRDDVAAAAEVLIGAGADMAGLVLTCTRPGRATASVPGAAGPAQGALG